MFRYCPKCGKELPRTESLRFCPYCGAEARVSGMDTSEAKVLELLHQGRKIEAIKAYRDRTGFDLRNAKEQVEAIARRHGIPDAGSLGSPGRGRSLALAVMALLVLAAAGLALFIIQG